MLRGRNCTFLPSVPTVHGRGEHSQCTINNWQVYRVVLEQRGGGKCGRRRKEKDCPLEPKCDKLILILFQFIRNSHKKLNSKVLWPINYLFRKSLRFPREAKINLYAININKRYSCRG